MMIDAVDMAKTGSKVKTSSEQNCFYIYLIQVIIETDLQQKDHQEKNQGNPVTHHLVRYS